MSDPPTPLLIRQVAEETARRAVVSTLTTLGIDAANPLDTQRDMAVLRELRELVRDPEFRKDLAYLRSWRLAMGHIQSKGILTLVGLILTGLCAAVWAGLKNYF